LFISIVRIHAVLNKPPFSVGSNRLELYEHLDVVLQELGLDDAKSEDIVHPVVGYHGNGYGKSTPSELGESNINTTCYDVQLLLCPVHSLIQHIQQIVILMNLLESVLIEKA